MNTKNNRRKRESKAKIESVFMELLQTRELNRITVSDICKLAGVNRSTFYANYGDIYVLADTVRENLERNLGELYRDQVVNSFNDNDYLKLFRHIAENPLFYQTYFKLGYDNRYQILAYDKKLAAEHFDNRFIPYHIAFYKRPDSGHQNVAGRRLPGDAGGDQRNCCQRIPGACGIFRQEKHGESVESLEIEKMAGKRAEISGKAGGIFCRKTV